MDPNETPKPQVDPALAGRLESLVALANEAGADGIWLIRGAKGAGLRYYYDPPEACPYCGSDEIEDVFDPTQTDVDRFRCHDCDNTWENGPVELAPADAELLVLLRFPAGDGGEPGIESR